MQSLAHAEALGHHTSVLAETQGDAFYNLGNFPKSLARYKTALHREPANSWLQSKLGLVLVRIGDTSNGLRHLDAAILQRPDSGELYDRKMLAYLSMGNLHEAAQTLEDKLSQIHDPASSDFLRAASLWSKANNLPRASAVVERGLQKFPKDKNLLMAQQELFSPLTAKD